MCYLCYTQPNRACIVGCAAALAAAQTRGQVVGSQRLVARATASPRRYGMCRTRQNFFIFYFFNNILNLTRIGFYLQEVTRLVAPPAPARQIAFVAPVHVARQGGHGGGSSIRWFTYKGNMMLPHNGVYKHVLQRVFWYFPQCAEAFQHCRPVILVDATFLTGKYKGH